MRPPETSRSTALLSRWLGKRRMLAFGTYGEAKKTTEDKVKELHKGQQSSALTAKQAQDALTVHDMLAAYRQETGKVVSIVEITDNYLSAVKQLPKGCSLTEAVRVYRQSTIGCLKLTDCRKRTQT